MRLFELFDNPVSDIEWEETVLGEDARFRVGEYVYNVSFSPVPPDAFEEDRSIPRSLMAMIDNDVAPIDIEFQQYKAAPKNSFITGTDGTHEITGTGNEIKVFSTVVDIIQNWISRNPNEQLVYISAKEPSRVKLYRRMVNSFAKGKKVWELVSTDDEKPAENYTYWVVKL